MKISLFYENVTVLDYAYLDEHLGIVGDSLKVNVEFFGKTDEEGVVFDFSYAKKKVKEIIDRDCDHRLVVPHQIANFQQNEVSLKYFYGFKDYCIDYKGPAEAVCEIPSAYFSKENLLYHLENLVMKEMPTTVSAVKLSFEEESLSTNDSFFHYTHGLKEHYGNCQRLLHGHRSTINIFVNGQRCFEKEKEFAQELFSGNIHFCFWDNVVNKDEIIKLTGKHEPVGRFQEIPSVEIKYMASQGEFSAKLAGNSVYFVPYETTVENLSIHFCELVKAQRKNSYDIVSVRAFEGIAKGSRATL